MILKRKKIEGAFAPSFFFKEVSKIIKWIFLIIGVIIGFLISMMLFSMYHANRTYGVLKQDRRNENHYIFRLEWTKDPITIGTKTYILLSVEDAELKSIQVKDLE